MKTFKIDYILHPLAQKSNTAYFDITTVKSPLSDKLLSRLPTAFQGDIQVLFNGKPMMEYKYSADNKFSVSLLDDAIRFMNYFLFDLLINNVKEKEHLFLDGGTWLVKVVDSDNLTITPGENVRNEAIQDEPIKFKDFADELVAFSESVLNKLYEINPSLSGDKYFTDVNNVISRLKQEINRRWPRE